jgi:hypothetical protein
MNKWKITGLYVINALQFIENQLKSVLKCLIINLNQEKQVQLYTL